MRVRKKTCPSDVSREQALRGMVVKMVDTTFLDMVVLRFSHEKGLMERPRELEKLFRLVRGYGTD